MMHWNYDEVTVDTYFTRISSVMFLKIFFLKGYFPRKVENSLKYFRKFDRFALYSYKIFNILDIYFYHGEYWLKIFRKNHIWE